MPVRWIRLHRLLNWLSLTDCPMADVDALLDAAFGTDRRLRTAYRIRAGAGMDTQLSFGVREAGTLVGAIQCWPIALHGDDGTAYPLIMVGPVAVAPSRQRSGLGQALMERTLASTAPAPPLMLIGDPEYYGRFFGFSAAQTGRWRTPGPVEPRRLLARGRDIPDCAGLLGPRDVAVAA